MWFVCEAFLEDWEIGIIVGAFVGVCCIVVCIIVVIAMNR